MTFFSQMTFGRRLGSPLGMNSHTVVPGPARARAAAFLQATGDRRRRIYLLQAIKPDRALVRFSPVHALGRSEQ